GVRGEARGRSAAAEMGEVLVVHGGAAPDAAAGALERSDQSRTDALATPRRRRVLRPLAAQVHGVERDVAGGGRAAQSGGSVAARGADLRNSGVAAGDPHGAGMRGGNGGGQDGAGGLRGEEGQGGEDPGEGGARGTGHPPRDHVPRSSPAQAAGARTAGHSSR